MRVVEMVLVGQVNTELVGFINKLGGKDWQKTRSRVKSAVKDMAKELIELYSKRLSVKGHAFSPDIDMQNDFERRFEFIETDDQLRCINEIKKDMEKPYPMDRLLCGRVRAESGIQVRCRRQAMRHPRADHHSCVAALSDYSAPL